MSRCKIFYMVYNIWHHVMSVIRGQLQNCIRDQMMRKIEYMTLDGRCNAVSNDLLSSLELIANDWATMSHEECMTLMETTNQLVTQERCAESKLITCKILGTLMIILANFGPDHLPRALPLASLLESCVTAIGSYIEDVPTEILSDAFALLMEFTNQLNITDGSIATPMFGTDMLWECDSLRVGQLLQTSVVAACKQVYSNSELSHLDEIVEMCSPMTSLWERLRPSNHTSVREIYSVTSTPDFEPHLRLTISVMDFLCCVMSTANNIEFNETMFRESFKVTFYGTCYELVKMGFDVCHACAVEHPEMFIGIFIELMSSIDAIKHLMFVFSSFKDNFEWCDDTSKVLRFIADATRCGDGTVNGAIAECPEFWDAFDNYFIDIWTIYNGDNFASSCIIMKALLSLSCEDSLPRIALLSERFLPDRLSMRDNEAYGSLLVAAVTEAGPRRICDILGCSDFVDCSERINLVSIVYESVDQTPEMLELLHTLYDICSSEIEVLSATESEDSVVLMSLQYFNSKLEEIFNEEVE